MPPFKHIRILIADDHPLIRTALKSMITYERDMDIVGEAKNGLEAVRLFKKEDPDITLMDLNMPELDGVGAIKYIRKIEPSARIIVLTNYDTDEDVYQGMQAGARGYLLKGASQAKLVEIIRRVHAGQKFIPKELAEKLTQRSMYPELTDREKQVLDLVKQGNTNRAIALKLGIAESTVKSHIKSILIKLNVNDRTQAVTTAIKRGILRPGE